MKIFIMMSVLLFSLNSFADKTAEEKCNDDMTREPYCMNIGTAKEYCKGLDEDVLNIFKKCFINLDNHKRAAREEIYSLCGAGHVTSSDEKLNANNCGQKSQKAPSRKSNVK